MLRWTHPWMVLLTLAASSECVRSQSVPKDAGKPGEFNRVSDCLLSGKVEGDYALLQAHFRFTNAPNSWIFLGLQGAFLADEGKLDGQLPLLKASEAGVEVYAEKPPSEKDICHNLILNFRVPVKVRRSGTASTSASERSLELGLPGAAVNTLTIDLPPTVKDLRVNDNSVTRKQPGRWSILGFGPPPVNQLKLSWKEPVALPGTDAMLTSEATVTVKVEDTQVHTRAELVLEDLRGQTKEWQFLFPTHVQQNNLRIEPIGLIHEIFEPNESSPFFTLRFTEPLRQSFKVTVNESRALDDARTPVGPFYVVGAQRQAGTIAIEKSPTALIGKRLEFQRRPQVFGKASGQGNALAEFQFSSLPRALKNMSPAKLREDLSLLDFQVKPDRGQYETRVEHQLNLQPSASAWLVTATTKIKVKSQAGPSGFVDVQLPRGEPASALNLLSAAPAAFPAGVPWAPVYLSNQPYWPAAAPRDFVCEQLDGPPPLMQTPDEQQRCRIALTGTPLHEFTIVLTGEYRLPRQSRRLKLQLPTPVGSIDRGAKFSADIDEQFEFVPNNGVRAQLQHHRLEWETGRTPESIELTWKPYHPEMPVSAVVDITIHDQYARIRQELSMPINALDGRDGGPTSLMMFQIPAEVKALPSPTVFFGFDAATRTASAPVPADEPLSFEYSVSIPPGAERVFSVPLIWPVKATRLEAKVRVWTPAGTVVHGQDSAAIWDNLHTEFVTGRDTLPGLVLRGVGSKLPLTLRVEEPADAKVADIVFDRGLIDVRLEPNGEQLYRLRFLVQKLNADLLTISFPGRPSEVVSSIRLSDTNLPWGLGEKDTVQVAVSPDLVNHATILELRYKLPPANGDSGWQTLLRLPKFHGDVLLGRLRWQVSTPKVTPEVTAFIFNDEAQVEYRWGLQNNWLPAPLPAATSAELEQWLNEGQTTSAGALGEANLLFWRGSLEPVRLWHLSQPLMFAICSSMFLLIGLGLHLAPISRYSFWLLVALLGLIVVAAGMLWPSILPVIIFACQPGVVILVLILTVQWMLHGAIAAS